MKHINGAKLLTVGLVVVMILTFVILFVYGLSAVLEMEGSFPPVINAESLTPAPTTKEELVAYLNQVVLKAQEKKPQLSVSGGFDVDEGTLEISGTENLKQTMLYAMGGLEGELSSHSKTGTSGYGQDMNALLNVPAMDPADILSFECDYIFYACGSCGAENKEHQDHCEACGNVYPYSMRYRDEYSFTVHLAVSDVLLEGNFGKRSNGEIHALYGNGFQGFLDVTSVTPEYKELLLSFRVNRLTDELTFLEYAKKMHIASGLTFTGSFATLGDQTASFDITERESYTFTWPSLVLDQDVLTLAPKGTDNLLATVTCGDPLGAIVKWTSSDESTVTVDQQGYLAAGKKAGTAVITAEFDFMGVTYSDSCTVHVRVAVESSNISKRKLTLDAGEEYSLSIKVSPSNATVQTVTWHSENEDIATVDANGTVHAIAPGTVVIYALTDDGYYKSSCEVTVE